MQPTNVRLRLVAAFALLIAALVIVGWQGASHLRRLNAQTQEIFSNHWQKSKISREAFRLSNLNNRITLLVFMLDDQDEIQRLLVQRAANTERISELVSLLEVSLDKPEEKRLLAAVKTRRTPYVNTDKRALATLITEGKREEARRIMIQETLPLLVAYHDAWNDFYQYQSDEMATAMLKSKIDFATGERQFLLMVGVAGLITLVIAGFTVWRTGREIAERKQATEALRRSEARYRSFVMATTLIAWVTDADGMVVEDVPMWRAFTGQSYDEIKGNGWVAALHAEDRERAFAVWKHALETKSPYATEYRLRKDNGEYRYFSAHGAPVIEPDGSVWEWMGTCTDITERKQAEAKLEQMHKQLLETSRQAGRAEVATSVLHNVGNVLNSVNVASSCVADSLKKSKAANLSKVVALMRQHEADLGAFLTGDPNGKQIPSYLAQLAEHLASEQTAVLKELAGLQKNIEHIKDIVTMQQSFAKVSGVTETLQVTDLVEDALRMNASALARYDIQVIKQFKKVPPITVEKNKVLQILVNLVRNAKQACDDSGRPEKQLTFCVSNGDNYVRIAVSDNGVGILPENMERIFSHGFTTKKDGHGFGLHSGALAAKEMGGSLTVHSDGAGKGAAFTLTLPMPCPPKEENS